VFLALLIIAGLSWVSVSSLRVEQAQLDAAARADRMNKERLALWRLDSQMLPPIGLESNRPYSHYFALYIPSAIVLNDSGDPSLDPGRVPSPLLSADLPEWARIYIQLDPVRGWLSPQVIPSDLADRLMMEPLDLSLLNVTNERAELLAHLRTQFPAISTVSQLAEHDRIEPDLDPYYVPVPLADDASTDKPTPHRSPRDPAGWYKPSPIIEVPQLQTNQNNDKLKSLDDAAGYARLSILGFQITSTKRDENSSDSAKSELTDAKKKKIEPKPEPLPITPAMTHPVPVHAPIPTVQSARTSAYSDLTPDDAARKQLADQVARGRGFNENKVGNSANNLKNSTQGTAPAATGSIQPIIEPEETPSGEFRRIFDWTKNLSLNLQNRSRESRENEILPREKEALSKDTQKEIAGAKKSNERQLKEQKQLETGEYLALAKPINLAGNAAPSVLAGERKSAPMVQPSAVHLGPIRSRWLRDAAGHHHLFLIRTAKLEQKTVYQGVLVNWPLLKTHLLAQLADLFPNAELKPLDGGNSARPERTMTSIPVELDPGLMPVVPSAGWSPLRLGLLLSWVAALLAILAVAFGSRAILALSERRIRFASAVTHELRSPLTAMQLHLDLLNSGLITDEDKKAEYLATVATEADRLNRLVENVLDFARLEKKTAMANAHSISACTVLESVRETWHDRLKLVGFELIVTSTISPDTLLKIDARVISQVLSNLLDNARKYAAHASDKRIWLWLKPSERGRIVFEVEDRGPGIPTAERRSVFRPFQRGSVQQDSGGVGLGLALAKQWAEMFGGSISYRPADGGTGACFRMELPVVNG